MSTDRIMLQITITETIIESRIFYTATILDQRTRKQRIWNTNSEISIDDCIDQIKHNLKA